MLLTFTERCGTTRSVTGDSRWQEVACMSALMCGVWIGDYY